LIVLLHAFITVGYMILFRDFFYIIQHTNCVLWFQGIETLPGPGAYEPKTVPDSVPKISIGLPVHNPFKNDAPAPNAYTVKSGIGSKNVYELTNPEPLVRSRTLLGSPYYSTIKDAVPGLFRYVLLFCFHSCIMR